MTWDGQRRPTCAIREAPRSVARRRIVSAFSPSARAIQGGGEDLVAVQAAPRPPPGARHPARLTDHHRGDAAESAGLGLGLGLDVGDVADGEDHRNGDAGDLDDGGRDRVAVTGVRDECEDAG
jgi:hypothetical protein